MPGFLACSDAIRPDGDELSIDDCARLSEARTTPACAYQNSDAAKVWPHLQLLHAPEGALSEQGADLY